MEKSADVREWLNVSDVDIMGMTETNVNWSKVDKKDKIWQRIRGWFESLDLSVAYNCKDTICNKFQFGGVATFTKN